MCTLIETLSYCTPAVLISLKFSPMRPTPGLSSHHYHPEFAETLQYDMANGLAIDFVRVRENGRWRGSQKGTSGRGQGGWVCKGLRCQTIQEASLHSAGNTHNLAEINNCVRKEHHEVNSFCKINIKNK